MGRVIGHVIDFAIQAVDHHRWVREHKAKARSADAETGLSGVGWMSGSEFQGFSPGFALDGSTLSEPGRVKSIVLIAGASFVINELGDGIQ